VHIFGSLPNQLGHHDPNFRTEESLLMENKIDNTRDTKKRELLKNPTKIEKIQEKKFIDRN